MTKKIFDILPPGKNIEEKKRPVKKSKISFNVRYLVAGVLVFLFLAATLYQALGTSFILYLEPATKIVNLETELRVSSEAGSFNLEEGILVGREITKEVSETRSFNASGQRSEESLARGVIRVYNAVSPPREINLRATTRFLASSGEYFKAPNPISLSPAKIEGGRLVPSITEVPVEAMDPGEPSNIGPTKFSIPGLSGTELYDKIYGESVEVMSGGSIALLSEVTRADLRQAEDTLRINLVNEIIDGLEEEDATRVILADAISVEVVESNVSAEAGQVIDNFDYYLSVKGRALTFSKEDLNQLLVSVVKRETGEDYEIVPGSLYLDYRMLSYNSDNQTLRTNIKFSAEVYQGLDLKQWSEGLVGLNRSGLKERILGDEEIRAFQFRLTPFWLRKIPREDRIEIQLRFR